MVDNETSKAVDLANLNKVENPAVSAPYEKWGEALDAGFQLLPDVLLKHQHRLGLKPTDVLVLIHLTMNWWYAERLPFPRPSTIARRMGVGVRTVQRSLRRLEDLRLVKKVRQQAKDVPVSFAFDLSALVKVLQELALVDTGYRDRRAIQHNSPEEQH